MPDFRTPAPAVAFMPAPIAGRYLPQRTRASTQNNTLTLDRCLLRFQPVPVPVTLDAIAIRVTTGQASSVIRLGLYDLDEDGEPGALLVDAGTVDASSAADLVATFTAVSVTNGGVYVACVAQVAGGTVAVRGGSNYGDWTQPTTTAAAALNNNNTQYLATSVSGALPDPFVSVGTTADGPSWTIPRVAALL